MRSQHGTGERPAISHRPPRIEPERPVTLRAAVRTSRSERRARRTGESARRASAFAASALLRAALLNAVLAGGLWIALAVVRVPDPAGALSEGGFVEIAQLALLASAAVSFALRTADGRTSVVGRVLAWILIAALCRELDGAFDRIAHGSWKVPAYLAVTLGLRSAWRNRRVLLEELDDALDRRACGLLVAALFVVLLHSRILGRQAAWGSVLGDAYQRDVPRLIEEMVELVGYGMLVVGAIDWRIERARPRVTISRVTPDGAVG